MIIAAIILIPAIFGLFMIIGAFSLSERHAPLRIGMLLLSVVSIWTALHFGLVSIIKFYNFPELVNLIGSTTRWTGIIFFILLAYFLFYAFKTAIDYAAQKKQENLEY